MYKTLPSLYFFLSLLLLFSHPHAIAESKTEEAQAISTGHVAQTEVSQQASIVNVNTASADVIATSLTGIGLKKAKAIVAFREANGPFKSVEELALVKGIGSKTVKNNESKIKLK